MSKFKIGLTVIFSAFIIIAVIIFAASKSGANKPAVKVTVWGFLSSATFNQFLEASPVSQDKTLVVNYVQENPQTFENDFINALANGTGPDVIMVSQDSLFQNENKIFTIPYANYSERNFLNSFVDEGQLFLNKTGVMAVPFEIDPLVMYWNKDTFNSAGIANPPQYWDQILTLPQTLSKTDSSGNVTQSAVSFGEWNNVDNAKAILSQLLLSAGSVIVDTSVTPPQSVLTAMSGSQIISPAESSVDFYTQFANPTSQTYSWNRALPDSLTSFLSGNLALYFGFASELPTIRAKNPNLNFDVTAVPQSRGATKKVVFANIYGLAIVKSSKNISADFQAISEMTSDASLTALGTLTNLPPVSRTLLATLPADPYQTIFYQSALLSQGWLDPDTSATDQIFQTMIESITSGQAKASDAISSANSALNSLFN